jgi:hypothetical protein
VLTGLLVTTRLGLKNSLAISGQMMRLACRLSLGGAAGGRNCDNGKKCTAAGDVALFRKRMGRAGCF